MAFIISDRVLETSTTTGTGTLTLAGATTGYRTFGAVMANNDTCYYAIAGNASAPSEWEVGYGTWATGGTLARTTVIASSNANAAVNLSAGTKNVYITDAANGAHVLAAGINTRPPLKFTSGTALSTAAAGAVEYDGVTFAKTIDATSGRGLSPVDQIFKLTANGAAIGNTIADYFGANAALDLVASATYLLEAELYFLKTTNGTVTITLTTSAANYTNIVASFIQGITGGAAVAAMTATGIVTTTTAAAALPATNSLTTATNYFIRVWATIETNAAGNFRIRATEGAGTITPLRGSIMRLRRIPAGNVGNYVA